MHLVEDSAVTAIALLLAEMEKGPAHSWAHPDLRAGGPHLVIQICVCDPWSLVPSLKGICSLGYLSGKQGTGSVWPQLFTEHQQGKGLIHKTLQ